MPPPAGPRYRPELSVIDLWRQPAGPQYRPELRVIDLCLHPPALDIDRSSALSTYGSTRRPSISTGAQRYRPMAPARRPRISTGARRYRPMAPARRPRISTGPRRYRPMAQARRPALSTGARSRDTRYRPEPCPYRPEPRRYRPELHSYRPEPRRYRPELGIRDARYRPEFDPETPDIDRSPVTTCAARSAARAGLETGVPSRRVMRRNGTTRLRPPAAGCAG